MFFTEMFRITEVKSAGLPLVEEDNFEVELMTFRVKRNRDKCVLERLDESKSVRLDGTRLSVEAKCCCLLANNTTIPEDSVE